MPVWIVDNPWVAFLAAFFVVALVLVVLRQGHWLTDELVALWAWVAWAGFGTIGLLGIILSNWTPQPQDAIAERRALLVVGLLGGLGGFVRWMDSLWRNRKSDDLPTVESFLWPLQGAAVATVTVLTYRAGIVSSAATSSSVNWSILFGIAGLAGLFAPQVIQALKRAANAFFATDE